MTNMFEDYFNAYKNTSKYKDDSMLEISIRKKEFEKNLDDMWSTYMRGVPQQIVEYNKQVEKLKELGFKILRNSQGKHAIRVKNNHR